MGSISTQPACPHFPPVWRTRAKVRNSREGMIRERLEILPRREFSRRPAGTPRLGDRDNGMGTTKNSVHLVSAALNNAHALKRARRPRHWSVTNARAPAGARVACRQYPVRKWRPKPTVI